LDQHLNHSLCHSSPLNQRVRRHSVRLGLSALSVLVLLCGFDWDDTPLADKAPIAGYPVYDLNRDIFELDDMQSSIIQLVNNWEKAFLKEDFAALEQYFSLPFYADKRIASNLTGFREITKSWFEHLVALRLRVEGEDKPIEITISRIDKTRNTGLENQIVGFLGPLQLTELDYVVIVKYRSRETTFLIRIQNGAPKIVGVY